MVKSMLLWNTSNPLVSGKEQFTAVRNYDDSPYKTTRQEL